MKPKSHLHSFIEIGLPFAREILVQEVELSGHFRKILTGEVFAGEIKTREPNFNEEADLQTLLGWADEVRRLQVWANGDYPRDAAKAREFVLNRGSSANRSTNCAAVATVCAPFSTRGSVTSYEPAPPTSRWA